MQQDSLLQTKLLVPPVRPELVSRPRLTERLNAGLDCKLTLISAPAGFGKTTLVAEWVRDLREAEPAQKITWLSLDEDDNDLARFLVYLITALRTIETNTGKGLLSQLRSPQPPPVEEILTVLLNDMVAIPGRMILVLDDYHLISDQSIHEALAFLLARLPGQMHLIIATREDPDLPVARLRARGQLVELRAADLRFTSSEAAELLNQVMGLELLAEDIAALETRTEGWIAGLHLAAISMRNREDVTGFVRSFTGSHRFVLDYLIEEVLERQPESVQMFLLQTAILDRLTGSLCDAVCFGATEPPAGQHDGQAILETLDRANLFIVPLDDERHWYRYHHLFGDLLRRRLRQVHPEWIATLHQHASVWLEQNGHADDAVEHARQAGDLARATNLMETHADAAWRGGEHAKLRHWLDTLPLEAIRAKPRLCVYHTWYLFLDGHQDEAEQALQACEEMLEASPDPTTGASPPVRRAPLSAANRQMMRGRAAVIRAFIATYLGDIPAIIRHARQALDYLPEEDLTWRRDAALALGDAHGFQGDLGAAYMARLQAAEASRSAGDTVFSLLAHLKVAITLREQGRLQRTIELCQEQLEFAGECGLMGTAVPGGFQAIWGEVVAELGDLKGALNLANRGVERTERGGESLVTGWGYLCLARVLFSKGDLVGTVELANKVETKAGELQVPPWIVTEMAAWRARASLAQGDRVAAARWARQRGLKAGGELEPVDEFDFFSLNAYTVLARIRLAQERWEETGRLLSRLLAAAQAGGRTSKVIEILSLQAMAAQAQGNTELALAAIEQALTLAKPEGFAQSFVDEGPLMARLLYEAATRGIEPDYARRLLATFPDAQPAPNGSPATKAVQAELTEPLSERELEVLGLIAEGLNNREIASRLYLSLNTVKGHTRNIYGKLGVHSRTQAAAQARSLGLLPPF
ncbi:MAG: LuxR C-terminal-related transcriptional regulator [Anaerolineae bacterium]|jgi:LuxR family maltose regulon positive regulatory protein